MKKTKERQMKDARQMVMKEIDQRMLDCTEFNIEMLDKVKCKKILGFYEARKLDVLSILSNPFKHQFDDKNLFVLELAIEQAKIEDQIFTDYGITFSLFIKACNAYGMMKTGNTNDISRDAKVIGNQLKINL